MIKTMFAFGTLALMIAAPATAQMAAATGGTMPKCSATVRDSCDQSATTEKYAMSADEAMKTGGVGDRKSDNAAKPMAADHSAMAAHSHTHHKMHHAVHHDAMAPDAKPM